MYVYLCSNLRDVRLSLCFCFQMMMYIHGPVNVIPCWMWNLLPQVLTGHVNLAARGVANKQMQWFNSEYSWNTRMIHTICKTRVFDGELSGRLMNLRSSMKRKTLHIMKSRHGHAVRISGSLWGGYPPVTHVDTKNIYIKVPININAYEPELCQYKQQIYAQWIKRNESIINRPSR